MNVFTLFGEIAIRAGNSEKEIEKIVKKASSLAEKIGEFTINLVGESAKNTNVISEYAKKFGMTYERVQELNYILKQSGSSIEQFEGSLTGFAAKMDKANEGNKAAVELFGRLGVAVADSNYNLRGQGEVLWDTLKALQAMENETERAALATQLFGTNGADLLDVLSGEKGSIEDLRKKAHDLNLILNDELVEGGAKFSESVDMMNYNLATSGTLIGASVLPALNTFLDFINDNSDEIVAAFQKVSSWIVDNSEAVGAAFLTIAGGMAAAAIAAHPYAAAVLAVVAGLKAFKGEAQGLMTGANYDKFFDKYTDEDLQTLQAYVDAVNAARAAEEAYTNSGFDEAFGKQWEDALEKQEQAFNAANAIEGLIADYNAWRSGQAANQGKDLYLDVPLRVKEGSESAIQSELGGMSLKAWVKLMPDTSQLETLGRLAEGKGVDGSHANGLDRVPFDGYRAILHRNEAVLTAGEAAIWRNGNSFDNVAVQEISRKLDRVSNILQSIMTNTGRDQSVILDTGVLVGNIAPRIDTVLGTIAARRGRG